MTKEKLTLENIKADLLKSADSDLGVKFDWRLTYIVPYTMLAITLAILFKNFWIGLAIFLFPMYHIVRLIGEKKEFNAKKRTILALIDRGDIVISTEVLNTIEQETIYEPHSFGGRTKSLKEIKVFYFLSGASWRVIDTDMHYQWSKELYLTPAGLENISVKGNEFYFVSLQDYNEVSYVYPCKFFELDNQLIK